VGMGGLGEAPDGRVGGGGEAHGEDAHGASPGRRTVSWLTAV
jgi:hypothetical protein